MGRTTRHVGLLTVVTLLALSRPTPAGDAVGRSTGELTDLLKMADDADPETRAAARERLLGLTCDDLPALRDAARPFVPMSPELTDALREVVLQAYARRAVLRFPVRRAGMLGVRWRDPVSPVFDPNDTGDGATVDVRLPGYVAYRYLESGDRVTAVIDGDTEVPIGVNGDLGHEIRDLPPGDVIGLRVVRGGRLLTVTLPLDGHFVQFDDTQAEAEKKFIDDMLSTAAAEANGYFRREFAGVRSDDS